MEILTVTHLTKRFGTRVALDDVTFGVERGEFLSILGPSGCGKTTLLRILIGLLPPDSGTLLLNGTNITHAAPDQRSMGIVFQNYALFENMTVLKNVEYAMRFRPSLKKEARSTALHLLEQVGLSEHLNKYPAELSGGQQQRVAIARTLALKPEIILFDEPMSALDVATRLTLRAELKELQKTSGTTMIYITHDQEEAFSLSDRVMVMGEAKIHQLDTPENILCTPADDYVRGFVLDNLRIKTASLARYHRFLGEGGET
ncbi:MAG: ABC transporter ATP-binding protein [Ruminococcaceae bacterium]|nr:ABC transporter ATP-binding protein [Oscillospiraceae bacterium]